MTATEYRAPATSATVTRLRERGSRPARPAAVHEPAYPAVLRLSEMADETRAQLRAYAARFNESVARLRLVFDPWEEQQRAVLAERVRYERGRRAQRRRVDVAAERRVRSQQLRVARRARRRAHRQQVRL